MNKLELVIRDALVEAWEKDVGAREDAGKNRSGLIDKINREIGSKMGEPYCIAGLLIQGVKKVCKDLNLVNPVAMTPSTQSFWKKTPTQFRLMPGDLPSHGDIGCMQSRKDPSHGHCYGIRDDQASAKEHHTVEYNTDASGGRDGDGVYNSTRTSAGSASKKLLGYVQVAKWIASANSDVTHVPAAGAGKTTPTITQTDAPYAKADQDGNKANTSHHLRKKGDKGDEVVMLQKLLALRGASPGAADGVFGHKTDAAVRAFQASQGLMVDGVVGTKTWRALGALEEVIPQPPAAEAPWVPKTDADYEAKFHAVTILPQWKKTFIDRAELLGRFRDEFYRPIGDAVGCPWELPALIHNQEKGSDVGHFKAVLHNGELLVGTGKLTTIVPKGKGPFSSFVEAGIDALGGHGALLGHDWSTGQMLRWLENYNGPGYRNHGVPSPYVWSGTSGYVKGHYHGDHDFRPEEVSKNYGVAGILKAWRGEV